MLSFQKLVNLFNYIEVLIVLLYGTQISFSIFLIVGYLKSFLSKLDYFTDLNSFYLEYIYNTPQVLKKMNEL